MLEPLLRNRPKKISINESIPGYKSKEQLLVLGELVNQLPWFSKIVEIGSCAGRGTWAISKNAPPFSKVYAIDLWRDSRVFKGVGFCLDDEARDSIEYFKAHIKDCKNVECIKGEASSVDFDGKIQCLILDCDDGLNRNDHDPIWEAWKSRLSSRALIVGANYYPESRPDEVCFADQIGQELGNLQHKFGIWWSHA